MDATWSVCVFCASSEEVEERDRSLARALGAGIAGRGWRLVYGGGDVGLMGEIARAVLDAGGPVTGVIPRKLVGRELALRDVDELIVTESMRERQRLMDERSDAFLVLPGGIGTLTELLEIITLRALGYHDRPVVLVDPDGYWQPLRELLDTAIKRGMASPACHELMCTVGSIDDALAAVERR